MLPGVLPEAAVFADRYRVIRCIAVGGMGTVYQVVHLQTERLLALKVMHPPFIQSEEMRARFRQEARVAAKIGSAHIVDVLDAGFDEATEMPFLVMELLQGEELGKRLERVKQFPAAEVVLYLHQTALALDKMHRAQIVHRDLKPANLFLCERDDSPPCIKVLDFGIAKLLADGSTQASATSSVGTPMYMAPEQFGSPAAVSPATDIFALGLIAYTLLVGESYWFEDLNGSGNVFAFAVAVTGGPREPASKRAARLGVTFPPAFDAWFARATAFSPVDRFPTASAAVRALANALRLPEPGHERSAPLTIISPNAGSAERRRRTRVAAITMATAVVTVAAAIVSYALPSRTVAAGPPAPVAATAIPQAAHALALAEPRTSPGSASVTAPPGSVPPAVSAASRPEIRPPRKTATKAGKDRGIYRRD